MSGARETVPLDLLRQVAQKLGLSAAGDAAAVRARIEAAGGAGFIDALAQEHRQQLAAIQGVTRDMGTVAGLGMAPLPLPDQGADVAGLLGQTTAQVQPPEGGQVETRSTPDAHLPAPPAFSEMSTAALAGGLPTVPAMADFAMGGGAGAVGTSGAESAQLPMPPAPAEMLSTGPIPTPDVSQMTAAAIGAGPTGTAAAGGGGPIVAPPSGADAAAQGMGQVEPSKSPEPDKGPFADFSLPKLMHGLVSGSLGAAGNRLGSIHIPGMLGLTGNDLTSFAGLGSVGDIFSKFASRESFGIADHAGNAAAETLGGAAASAGGDLGGNGDVVAKLDKIIELLQKLVDRESRAEQLGPQADGTFKSSLSQTAQRAATSGVVQAGAGLSDSIAGSSSGDMSSAVGAVVARALTMAIAAA